MVFPGSRRASVKRRLPPGQDRIRSRIPESPNQSRMRETVRS